MKELERWILHNVDKESAIDEYRPNSDLAQPMDKKNSDKAQFARESKGKGRNSPTKPKRKRQQGNSQWKETEESK